MDRGSGGKGGKIKIKSSAGGTSQGPSPSLELSCCVGNPNILAALQEGGGVILYDMTTTKAVAHIPPSRGNAPSSGGRNARLSLLAQRNDDGSDRFTLLLDDCLYTVTGSTARSSEKSSSSSTSHQKLSQLACEKPAAIVLRSNHKLLAMIYQRSLSECQVEWMDLSDDRNGGLPAMVKLGEAPKTALKTGDDEVSQGKKKRKVAPKVLGPGQAGSETLPAVKKLKKLDDDDDDVDVDNQFDKKGVDNVEQEHTEMDKSDDKSGDDDKDDAGATDKAVGDGDEEGNNRDDDGADDNDDVEEYEAQNISIAERLQLMRDALEAEEHDDDAENDDDDDAAGDEDLDDDEDPDPSGKNTTNTMFKPKRATTDSLKEILTQALQSSDDSLLELALTVQDVKIIATSLRGLDDALLVTLLGKLTYRLATTPLRAESLSVWLSHCLKYGSYQPEQLAALRNLLYERIESFSDLLRLQGRLSMMVATE
jgi:hypothetical protein